MSSNNYYIDLLPPGSFGRELEIALYTAIFNNLNPLLKNRIKELINTGYIRLTQTEFDQLMKTIVSVVGSILPCKNRADVRPKLYGTGANDYKILGSMIGKKMIDKKQPCLDVIDYIRNSIGTSYPGLFEDKSSIQLVRTHHFSAQRNYPVDIKRVMGYHNLLTFLGGCISLLSSINLRMGGERPKRVEVYITPNESINVLNYSIVYTIINDYGSINRDCKTTIDKPQNVVKNLLNLESISFEVALLMALIIYLYKYNRYVRRFTLSNIDYFNLVKMDAEQRGQIRWVKPLILSGMFGRINTIITRTGGRINLIDTLYNMVKNYNILKNLKRKKQMIPEIVEEYQRVVADTIHSIYRYLETEDETLLITIAADLARLVSRLERSNLASYTGPLTRLISILA